MCCTWWKSWFFSPCSTSMSQATMCSFISWRSSSSYFCLLSSSSFFFHSSFTYFIPTHSSSFLLIYSHSNISSYSFLSFSSFYAHSSSHFLSTSSCSVFLCDMKTTFRISRYALNLWILSSTKLWETILLYLILNGVHFYGCFTSWVTLCSGTALEGFS